MISTASNHPHITLLVKIVDNLGDMGLALELIWQYRKRGYEGIFFIYTNKKNHLSRFFAIQKDFLGAIDILDLHEAEKSQTPLIISLFHTPIPRFLIVKKRLILRVDYLSFDPEWSQMTGKEHIFSTPETRIIEVVPAFFEQSAGVLSHIFEANTREKWLRDHHLDARWKDKKWLSLFVYDATFERLEFDLGDEWIVFVIGRKKDETKISHENIVFLDFLTIDRYYQLFYLTDSNVIRGDGSIVQAILCGKPLIWDIYKEIGGFPGSISEGFLSFLSPSEAYKTLHREFNTGSGGISLTKIVSLLEKEKWKKHTHTPLLLDTFEKYIDSFDFSI